ncbi:MAG: hypothetical protein RLZZ271_333 [Pseudomonadota bacterium]|jgi:PHD/YefM family antitoxin component YafN of YafNO toxin-antitoxin module
MQVTATEAKNRFGFVCAQAKREPVFVEKDGRVDSVILSAEQFNALQAKSQAKSMAQRKKEFHETYKEWIAEQQALIERVGIPGEELRPW